MGIARLQLILLLFISSVYYKGRGAWRVRTENEMDWDCQKKRAGNKGTKVSETLKNAVFWDVTPCDSYRSERFGTY
jgi:hypothetical protein